LQTTSRIHWTGSTTSSLQTRGDLSLENQLASWNFSSNCATTGDVASLPCVNGFTIPDFTPLGVYQFVWYWPYDKDQQQVPIGEEYFSCFDVNVTSTNAAVLPPSEYVETTSTTQAGNTPPTTTTSSDSCATSLDDCKVFCAPALASICNCDPTTGARNVQCAGSDTSTGIPTYLMGLSLIATLLTLL